jgi:polar amino acid transport system substrate-binding protein
MASLGQLVSGVAHEINNPNTFIRGNIAIIREAFGDIFPLLDARCAEDPDFKIARLPYALFREHMPVLIDDMAQGANRIKSIVDGLREYARREEGAAVEPVDLNEAVERCLRLVQNQIQRTARIDLDLDPALPLVAGNMQKLEQVLINILINASQAIDKEKGEIGVRTGVDEGTEEVVLRISDNGSGMDGKTLKQIFDPFFTTKRTRGGTGLGLAIAFRIIQEHRGRIDVESTPGKGTAFVIHLPRS